MDTNRIFILGLFLILLTSTGNADVTVTRSFSDNAPSAGDTITVTLAMVLTGDAPAACGLTENYPSGWTVSDISLSGADNAGAVEWLFWSMGNPIITQDITYDVTVPAGASGASTFSGTVDVGAAEDDDVAGETTVTVAGGSTDPVTVTRSFSTSTPSAGSSLTVTLAMDVTEGSEPAAIGITESIPTGWTVTSTSPTGTEGTDTVEWLFWAMGEAVEDTTITYVLTVPSSATGAYTFSGVVDYGGTTDPAVAGSTGVTVSMTHPVTVERSFSDSSPQPGSSLTVTLAMDVTEGSEPDAVGITESYPSDWTVTSSSPTGTTATAGQIEWLFWSMGEAVEDTTITYVLTIPEDEDFGDVTFTGTVDYGGTVDPDVGGSVEVTVSEEGDRPRRRYMVMTITGGEEAGDVITITVIDRNTEDPLDEVDIDIYLDGDKVFSELTDDDGIVEFTPTEPGTYLITADRTRYRDEEFEIVVGGEPVTTVPETTVTETTVTETTVPETTVTETTVEETTVPETTVAGTTAPVTTVPATVPTTVPAEGAPPVPMWLIVLIVLIVIIVIIYFVTKGGKGAAAPKPEEKKANGAANDKKKAE